jgi:AcrR family transcriptional regulator
MPKISENQREARRQQIMDAALVCFSRDGFHATTTADIVRESGVSQGTLYLYFANKDDIVVAMADDRHRNEALVTAIAHSEQDPVRGLMTMIELHGERLTDPRRIALRRVGVQGWSEALRNPRIHDSVVEGIVMVRQALATLIERGKRTGQIREAVDADAAARTLIAVFHGLVLQLAWDEPIDLPACGQVIGDMISQSLLTPEGRASLER